MKKLLLAGLLVVSAAAFGSMTHNEEVSADIEFSLRVRQPLSIAIENSSVDFGLLARGDSLEIKPTSADAANGVIKGEAGVNIVATHSMNSSEEGIELYPTLAVNGDELTNGGTFTLGNEAGVKGETLGFGAHVAVNEEATSGDKNFTVTYTFKYQ